MFRHQQYLEIPWGLHWRWEETQPKRRPWLLITLLILSAVFLIGIGVTRGVV